MLRNGILTSEGSSFPVIGLHLKMQAESGRIGTIIINNNRITTRFTVNSSSCTTTELSKLLTSCLTAVKNYYIKYCDTTYERDGTNLGRLIRILVKF